MSCDHESWAFGECPHCRVEYLEGRAASLEARVRALEEELGRCFLVAGGDPDGDELWRLASGALYQVVQLRTDYEYDNWGEFHDEEAIKKIEEGGRYVKGTFSLGEDR